MQSPSFIFYFLLLLGICFATTGCSVRNTEEASPLAPVISEPVVVTPGSDFPRAVVGAWNVVIDRSAEAITLEPAERSMLYHMPLTNIYPDVLSIVRYNFGPPLVVDIKLSHPLPGTGIDGFDPRVIAILPAKPGFSMDYPAFGVQANNSIVRNPDGYTKLWDNPSFHGSANPFIAYFKNHPYRIWPSTIHPEQTLTWTIDLNGFDGPMEFQLVVDVSTSYPDPPYGIVDNIVEPFEMLADIDSNLDSDGSGEALIEVTVKDWQGHHSIGGVAISSPDLFDGHITLEYDRPGDNVYEYVYAGTFTNDLYASVGKHNLLAAAWDSQTQNSVFQEFSFHVHGDIDFNFQDITPLNVGILALSIDTADHYVFIQNHYGTQYERNINIFDVADPADPKAIAKISGYTVDYTYYNDFLYCTRSTGGLQIFEMDPPTSPQLVQTVEPSNGEKYEQISIEGSLAFVITDEPEIVVIDIGIPEEAYILYEIPVINKAQQLFVENGYAFFSNGSHFYIYDVDPPADTHLVYEDDNDGECEFVHNRYAYLSSSNQIDIYDVSSPDTPRRVSLIYGLKIYDACVYENLLYISTDDYVVLYDITSPSNPLHINNVAHHSSGICAQSDYVFSIDSGSFITIDVSPPESANILNETLFASRADNLTLHNGYLYQVCGKSLEIIDVDPLSHARVVSRTESDEGTHYLQAYDNYLYLGSGQEILVVDISIPESASVANTVPFPEGFMGGVYIFNDKLMAISRETYAINDSWLYVFDITQPSLPVISHVVDFPGELINDFYLVDNLLYAVIRIEYGTHVLRIMDISSFDDPLLINEVPFSRTLFEIQIEDEFAFITWYATESVYGGLYTVDIHPPEAAEVVTETGFDGYPIEFKISGDYLYMANSNKGLQVFDIYPPDQTYLATSFDDSILAISGCIYLDDNIAYIGSRYLNLRVIQLW